jgi:hypothetical protein
MRPVIATTKKSQVAIFPAKNAPASEKNIGRRPEQETSVNNGWGNPTPRVVMWPYGNAINGLQRAAATIVSRPDVQLQLPAFTL